MIVYSFQDHQSMDIEQHEHIYEQEQIMIMVDGLEENEQDQDLLQQLVAEPTYDKNPSFNYDYQPAPILPVQLQYPEATELKVSNTSASTCTDFEPTVRKCFCTKTGCRKNYCQCFKNGIACTPNCQCVACKNQDRLFLTRSDRGIVTKCKCQKSHCMKNYCDCHSSGKKCGPACKCLQCWNVEEMVEQKQEAQREEQVEIDHHKFFDI